MLELNGDLCTRRDFMPNLLHFYNPINLILMIFSQESLKCGSFIDCAKASDLIVFSNIHAKAEA